MPTIYLSLHSTVVVSLNSTGKACQLSAWHQRIHQKFPRAKILVQNTNEAPPAGIHNICCINSTTVIYQLFIILTWKIIWQNTYVHYKHLIHWCTTFRSHRPLTDFLKLLFISSGTRNFEVGGSKCDVYIGIALTLNWNTCDKTQNNDHLRSKKFLSLKYNSAILLLLCKLFNTLKLTDTEPLQHISTDPALTV